jgi:hypothetical protein
MQFGFGVVITLLGITVVSLTLALLMLIISLPRLFLPKGSTEKATVSSAPIYPVGIPPEHIAAIAGALAMLGGAYRIRTVKIIGNENWERSRYTDIATL